MNYDIDVSIIIPARNEENYLPQCLAAIDALDTTKSLEVIVVDNASTDTTALIAEGHGALVLYEPIPGVGRARARGSAAARGKYILNIDADTRLPARYITEALQRFEQQPGLVCLGGRFRWYDAGNAYNAACWFFHMLFVPLVRLVSRGTLGPIGNNMICTHEAYAQTSGFDPELNFGEDADIARKLHRYGKTRLDLTLVCDTSSRRFRTVKDLTKHVVNTTYLCFGFAVPYNYLAPSTWRRAKSRTSIDKEGV
ncbi:MAG: family 2 glycosyl transferase [Candidatus Magasanikbacteria bacterium GW2011_GWC2_42_27]|uniref:Family 2 glycosyl transferase n=1 Tax=Candidatus Magasanikbacteria bacterium GW2011_GWE2_42_7 TaxID=1619052 RepID=A0A0G1DPP2_9BACT|nr:MAG: family 2 glycosyl transferase [Candidatus Magasanikbacteria bacterium GW2011_GWC2_42_27]KKS72796.1 MAG: family 2 glycosyl transferase [Candidatus Magasanikbacteria bacterium GW2011_GWE2_42_7]KKT25956.1 MAG: family 2 glycosyl transferase [Candidatus Magasanikbacteria bacterium GW2011_GWA2_43_9]